MTAYDLYAAFLREIEHWQAPVCEPADFTYRFNDARQAFIDEMKKQFEVHQVTTDELRAVTISASRALNPVNAKEATDARACPLPLALVDDDAWERGRYQFLTRVGLVFRFTRDYGFFKRGSALQVSADRYTDEIRAAVLTNYFLRPQINRQDAKCYYQVRGNTLELFFDTRQYPVDFAVVEEVEIGYIAAPKPIKLVSKKKDEENNVDSDWPAEVDRKVVKLCAALYLDQNRSAAQQGYAAENA